MFLNYLFLNFSQIYAQGVPGNMTAGEKFKMSSSIYCIRYYRLFAVYLV